ncbi:MAG: preprotein translocase subunit SecG, partial [bacterium]
MSNPNLTIAADIMGISYSQFGVGLLMAGLVIISLLLILIVLIQKPQGGGLSGAFGSGSGSGQTAFGTRTGDALTWLTITFFVLYIASAIGMNYASRPSKPAEPAPAGDTAPGGGRAGAGGRGAGRAGRGG